MCSYIIINCTFSGYRLVGGCTAAQGRVEVFFDGQWGSVCDDGFSTDEALVVCRSCGYGMVNAVRPQAFFGEGDSNSPIWLDDVDCRGDESEISDCAHLKLGEHNCGHHEDVGVECSVSIIYNIIFIQTSLKLLYYILFSLIRTKHSIQMCGLMEGQQLNLHVFFI